MSPITHFFVGWLAANADSLSRRERALVVVAGVIPDADGFGVIAETLTKNSDTPLYWWSKFHHVLAHNIGFGLFYALVAFLIAKKRLMTAGMALVAFHLHLLGDLIGAKGPEGDQWPIPYLLPFSKVWNLAWSGQWALNAWPNFVITGFAIAATFYLAWKRGFSPIDLFSKKADAAFVGVLRNRFGEPK